MDDTTTVTRVRALESLCSFLKNTPIKLLRQTGLGEVFEDAVMPTLLFLPSLTPVDESIQLLKSAYAALNALAETRFPIDEDREERARFLDKIMRQGILQGYIHCSENTKIVQVLMEEGELLVKRMGIYAVKHLKVSQN